MSASAKSGAVPSRLVLLGAILIVGQLINHVSSLGLSSQGDLLFSHPRGARVSSLIKRSLCNTFGGCGAKRSASESLLRNINDQATGESTNSRELLFDELPPSGDSANQLGENYQSTKNKLINGILEDLFEHLQTDERFAQGKLVVIIPGGAVNSESDKLDFLARREQQRQLFNALASRQAQTMAATRRATELE